MIETNSSDMTIHLPSDTLAVFTTPNAMDQILSRIRKELDGFVADISTASGRKAVASMAYKVARAKTYLDDEGKRLVAKQKEIPNKIDACRKHVRDTLDKWKDEVRSPLTQWEEAEAARVERIKSSMAELEAVSSDQILRSSQSIRERLSEIESEAVTEQFYQEFHAAAIVLKDRALSALRSRLADSERREAEQAELDRLRAAEAARLQKEREEKIAVEAAARAEREATARAEAERKALEDASKRERDAAERRELELRLQAEHAERRAAEAEAKAQRDAKAKAESEQAEISRRQADEKHRATINDDAIRSFVSAGIDATTACTVVDLIAKKEIRHVSILY